MNFKKVVKIVLTITFLGSSFQFLATGGQNFDFTVWAWGVSVAGFFLLSLIEKPRNFKEITLWGTCLLFFGIATIIEFLF